VSVTREVGITVHLAVVCVCGFAWGWFRHRRSHALLFSTLGLLEAFLFLDAMFNWRWILHQALMSAAIAKGVYGDRRGPQIAALATLFIVTMGGMLAAAGRFWHSPGVPLALCGGVLSVMLWWIEVISLHISDRILQQQAGSMMVVAWLWIATSAMTAGGTLWAGWRARSSTVHR
jgi:hypothetical protein